MRVKLVTLRFAPSLGGFDDRPLADFVRDKEVLAVREHFFTVHELPHLACLVTYQEAAGPTTPRAAESGERPPRPSRADRPSPLADLTEAQRPLFQTLREWRSATARREGVPAYVILRDRDLAELVRVRPATPNALQTLPGIGPAKVERYGREILAILHGDPGPAPGPAPGAAEGTTP